MLSEKVRNYWKGIPFVWKSFLIYVPLFAGVFTFFLFIALIEIRINTTDRAKVTILEKCEKLKSNFNTEEIKNSAEELQIIIFSSKGEPISERGKFYHAAPTSELDQFQFLNNRQVLLYNTSLLVNSSIFYIQIAKNMAPENQIINTLKDFFILIIFSGLFISAALSIPLTKLSLKGIRNMAETAKEISYENLSTRIPIAGSGDEFDVLAATLNQMIDRIQISADAQKRFISNASHELRTPIAVIKGYAQLMTRWGFENEKIQKESAKAINEEVETIQRLLEDLLLMTRIDSKLTDLNVTEIDFNDLLNEIMRDNKILYPDREFKLTLEKKEIKIEGDRWLIKALVRIFTENASKYSPEESSIDYSITVKEEGTILSIIDHGEGIPDEHKEKVFQRFYRVDEDRSREKGGTGLGMAIGQKIIELHRGSVKVTDTTSGGATIVLQFPNIKSKEEG